MSFPFAPIYQVDCFYSVAGVSNRMRFHFVDKWGTQEAWRILRNVNDNLLAGLTRCLSTDWECWGLHVLRKYPEQPVVELFEPRSFTGQVNSPAVHHALKACISLYTGFRGRSMRGRKFLGGMPQSFVDGRRVNRDGKHQLDLEWGLIETVYHSSFENNPLVWGLLHRYVDGSLLQPLPENFTAIEQAIPRWRMTGFKRRPVVLPFP